jgi:hypothetical protein
MVVEYELYTEGLVCLLCFHDLGICGPDAWTGVVGGAFGAVKTLLPNASCCVVGSANGECQTAADTMPSPRAE